MRKKKKTITALNISDSLITCVISSLDDKTSPIVLASASMPARGMENGAISDLSEMASSISKTVEKTEAQAHTKVLWLIANCNGTAMRSYNTRGSITIAEKESEISGRDIERVTQAAKTIALPFDREIVHSVIRGFILDGQDSIKDPFGMLGARLEVDMQIVTGLITNMHNLRRTINAAGFEIQDILLSGVAAGYAVLEELEKDLGVIFIYISCSSTHIVVYNASEIKSVEILQMGSSDIAELLATNFKIPRQSAPELLKRGATLDRASIVKDEKIVLKIGNSSRSISKKAVYEAVEPEVKKLISKINEKLKDMPFSKEAAAGCIVAGELTDIGGFLEMLELSLNTPVKMGVVKGLSGEIAKLSVPGEIVCIGLIKYWAQAGAKKKLRKNILSSTPIGKLIDKISTIFSEYF